MCILGIPLSGDRICEAAKHFYRQLSQNDDFKASSGWLDNFKKRFGIRQMSICGEPSSSNIDAVEAFKAELAQKINEMGLKLDQIYNARESGLFWKLLPYKTLVQSGGIYAPGEKFRNEKITFIPCANASGSHKTKLFVIGKANNPRAFTNSVIPVCYKSQKSGWMTKDILCDWFHNEFVPSVRKKLTELKLPQKALLLLDSEPGHSEDLTSADKQMCVMYMPPAYTHMNEQVIQAVKVYYRKKLLKTIVDSDTDIPTTLKNINLKDVVYSLDEAWHRVSKQLIKISWRKLLPQIDEVPSSDDENYNVPLSSFAEGVEGFRCEVTDIQNMSKQISAEELSFEELEEWATGRNETEPFWTNTDTTDEVQIGTENKNCSSNEEEVNSDVTKHSEAVSSFNTCIKWATENNIPWDQIHLLRDLRNIAINEEMNSNEEKTITDYLSVVYE